MNPEPSVSTILTMLCKSSSEMAVGWKRAEVERRRVRKGQERHEGGASRGQHLGKRDGPCDLATFASQKTLK